MAKQSYFQIGLLNKSAGNVVDNAKAGTIRSLVTGNPGTFVAGLALEAATTVTNAGLIDATLQSTEGQAFGIFAQAGVTTITNRAQGTISATAPRYAVGVHLKWTDEHKFYNYGTVTATSTGATGTPLDHTYSSEAWIVDSFVFSKAPIYVENSGMMSNTASGGSNPYSQAMAVWADFGTSTVINNGIVYSHSINGMANGVYMGTNAYDMLYKNTGAWITENETANTKGLNYSVWLENDSPAQVGTKGVMTFFNSGTIASNTSFAVSMSSFSTGPWEKATFTNTGTISGGWLGLGWGGDLDFYNSGDIYTTLSWIGSGSSNVNAVIAGLPTINPVLSGSANGKNTLTFKLNGTLQTVNGKPASGTDLSRFKLGSPGSIVVSGKTYKWDRFATVTGTCIPLAKPAAGPVGLTVRQVSESDAALYWQALPNATRYTIKRAQVSTGPYTTIATNVTGTSYTDRTAYQSLDSYYVVSAVVNAVETVNSSEFSLRHRRLTGAVIGTAASSAGTIAQAFDGDQNTFFDSTTASGGWIGYDLGVGAAPVRRIGFSPRNTLEARMIGGVFQGANQSDFSDATTLYTIPRKPLTGLVTAVDVSNTSSFRYVRYLGPSNGYTNISELQFYSQ